MPRLKIEKLPPHWLFVPSRRQVRELLTRLGADVRLVEFFGTGRNRGVDRVSLGFVESRVIEDRCCFYLRLWGVKEENIRELQEKLAQEAITEIERYILDHVGTPPTEVIKPSQLSLSFRFTSDGVRSERRVKVVDRHSYPTPAWWESVSPT